MTVNTHNLLAALSAPAPRSGVVHDDGARYTESGMRVPAAEVRARVIAEEAGRWLAFTTERTRMRPHTLMAKALASVAFSVHQGARSFALPSKLTGTSKHQRELWRLVRDPAEPWARLALDSTGDGLTALQDDEPLGHVQNKHLGWVRPLVPFGLTVHLARVTGHDYEAYTLGANVVFGHVGTALNRLLDALGTSGDPGGDGALTPPVRPSIAAGDSVVASGNGASTGLIERLSVAPGAHLQLVVRPEHDAVRPGADPADIVLFRRVDGTACASVEHVVRHAPTGVDWGRQGSGPADLSRSVLLALTDETTAERLYLAFETEVVAQVPFAGGVLRAADIRDWVACKAV